jgi:4-amino-4-deoxy-L-arabinose transferase-like glycosyltransferase
VKDEWSYSEIAKRVASGEGFALEITREVDGRPVTRRLTSLRPPAWPTVLGAVYAVTGDSVAAGRILACLLGAASVVLLLLWGRAVAGERAAWVAAALLAIWPTHVWVSGELLTEPIYVCLVLGFALALQTGRPLPAATLLGLAVLTRPAGALLLAPALLLVLSSDAYRGRRVVAAALLVLVTLALPVPWVVRNAWLHGRPLLTTNFGVTFFGGNNDLSLESEWPGRWHLPERVRADDPPDLGYYGWIDLDEAGNDRRFRNSGIRWIRENPGRFALLAGHKVLRFLDPDQHSEKGDRALKSLAGWASFAPLLLLALIGATLGGARGRGWTLAFGLIAAQLAVAIVFFGDVRVRLPAIPGFLLLGAAGIGWLAARVRPRVA